MLRNFISKLLLSSLFLGFAGCRNWDEFDWWAALSPDRQHLATINREIGGLGGDTWKVNLYSVSDGWKVNPESKHQVLWMHGCNLLYVFWIDDRTLEAQLDPTDTDCIGRQPTTASAFGIDIVVARPKTTAKRSLFGASPSSEEDRPSHPDS